MGASQGLTRLATRTRLSWGQTYLDPQEGKGRGTARLGERWISLRRYMVCCCVLAGVFQGGLIFRILILLFDRLILTSATL